jgi:hypothetical protein
MIACVVKRVVVIPTLLVVPFTVFVRVRSERSSLRLWFVVSIG